MSQKENGKNYTWSAGSTQDLCEGKLSFQSPEFSTRVTSSDCTASNTSDGFFNVDWRLLIKSEAELEDESEYPETTKKNQYISIFLRKVKETVFRVPVLKVTFSILHAVEGKKFSKHTILLDVIERQHYGFPDFISVHEFEKLNISLLLIKVKIQEMQKDTLCSTPLLKSSVSSDIALRIGEKIYPGHKVILAMGSRVFQEKFGNEKSISYLQVEDTEPEVFEELLKYIYTGQLHNLEEQAFVLFQAATIYEIHDLISECVDILIKNLKLENVFSVLSASARDTINPKIAELIDECRTFIRNNFTDVMNLDLCASLVKAEPRYLSDILIDICTYGDIGSMKVVETFFSKNHDVPLLCQCTHYEKFFNNETMKDVDIYVDEKKYSAHSLVLAARSPVFGRMFSHKMKESLTGIIHIDDVEPDVFFEVLRFMYSNRIDESKNITHKILVASDKYEIDDLKLLCESILEKKIEKLNPIDLLYMMTFTEDHNAKKLKERCLYHVIQKVCFDEEILKYRATLECIAESHAHLVLELLQKMILIIETKVSLANPYDYIYLGTVNK